MCYVACREIEINAVVVSPTSPTEIGHRAGEAARWYRRHRKSGRKTNAGRGCLDLLNLARETNGTFETAGTIGTLIR